MSTTTKNLRLAFAGFAIVAALTALGCDQDDRAPGQPSRGKTTPRGQATKKVPFGKNVTLEIQGDRRRVVLDGYVCRREGVLEQLLCRKLTKEHEAILAADLDARHAHAALLAAGAKVGSPVQFPLDQPKPTPPTGNPIKVWLEYKTRDGKAVKVAAQDWIRNVKTKKNLDLDWVFAGSQLIPDPDQKDPPTYAANDGNVICLANFDTAMLDLPIDSSKDDGGLMWEAHTQRIPPEDTPVRIVLEPVPQKKK